MKTLIESLDTNENVDYLLDTCFFVHSFTSDRVKPLVKFCKNNKVGMTTFNLEEFLHMHHKLKGHTNHHVRSFLKKKLISLVPIEVHPGQHDMEQKFVDKYDHEILKIIRDPSDAVLFAHAVQIGADILTRDKHHIFTAAAENYSEQHGIHIWNNFPHEEPQ